MGLFYEPIFYEGTFQAHVSVDFFFICINTPTSLIIFIHYDCYTNCISIQYIILYLKRDEEKWEWKENIYLNHKQSNLLSLI